MGRTNRYDDEDMRRRRDMREVLRDGEVLRVRMSDGLDPLQRAVAEHVAGGRKTITDGYGFAGEALQRPGFRLSSTANYDSVDAAYDQYDTRLRDAYKDADNSHTSSTEGVGSGGFAGRRVGDLCTVRGRFDVGEAGDRGTIQRVDGELCCVSDRLRSEDARDTRDHATRMQDIYAEVDRDMTEAWKNQPTR